MLMERHVGMPGPVYIESCGMIMSRGEVQRIDPPMRGKVDAWCAHHEWHCRIS